MTLNFSGSITGCATYSPPADCVALFEKGHATGWAEVMPWYPDDFSQGFRIDKVHFNFSVPEPSTFVLLALGIAWLAVFREEIMGMTITELVYTAFRKTHLRNPSLSIPFDEAACARARASTHQEARRLLRRLPPARQLSVRRIAPHRAGSTRADT